MLNIMFHMFVKILSVLGLGSSVIILFLWISVTGLLGKVF